MGVCYLLHFHQLIAPGKHTTRHYLGYAEDLERRIKEHRAGQGARLTEVAKERGITFSLVRCWIGDRKLERKLKNLKNGPKLCPLCQRVGEDVNFYV
jgi:predicted GIY-YIG superfamily endonuclease